MDTHPSPFLLYSTPKPSTPYSATFFRELTFRGAAELTFPRISPPKTISAWTFTDECPTDGQYVIQPNELIPNIADLIPILRDMENAYSTGARAVAISLVSNGQFTDSLYHFSKIRLLCHLNNNKSAVESGRALASHLMSIPLLSSSNLDTFLDLPICAPIFGFHVTEFPLWKLSCLLGEEWLHEDILNALAELLYFSLAANSPSGAPSTLILPTHCLHDAKYLFDQSPQSFSSNLAALRDRLQTTTVEKIFAFNCASNHYSLYSTTGTPELEHDDSLHLRPDSNVLSVFQWLLFGTGFAAPSSVKSSVVPRQAAGSGSCGIAALNFAESRLDTEVGPWETSTSPFFRNRALRDLILYHTYENWVMPCLLNGDSAESPIDHGPVGYNDFNLDAPNTLHPIHRFLGLAEHPLNASPLQNVQEPESSRRRHDSNLESLFAGPLKMLRDHAGPLALQTCYKQMQLSLFYSTEVIQRPNEVESWTAYALSSSQEPAFDWMPGEQNGTHFNALGHFLDNEAWSYILSDGRYVCDCCMPSNLGIPCRHYFRIWVDVQNMPFHISLIRPRWYQDPTFAAESIPAVCRNRELGAEEFRLPTRTIRSAFASNPIDNTSHETTPPPRTQTVPAREVFHNVQAAIRPLIAGIQTREQVSDLIQRLEDLQYALTISHTCNFKLNTAATVNRIPMKLGKIALWTRPLSLTRVGLVPTALRMQERGVSGGGGARSSGRTTQTETMDSTPSDSAPAARKSRLQEARTELDTRASSADEAQEARHDALRAASPSPRSSGGDAPYLAEQYERGLAQLLLHLRVSSIPAHIPGRLGLALRICIRIHLRLIARPTASTLSDSTCTSEERPYSVLTADAPFPYDSAGSHPDPFAKGAACVVHHSCDAVPLSASLSPPRGEGEYLLQDEGEARVGDSGVHVPEEVSFVREQHRTLALPVLPSPISQALFDSPRTLTSPPLPLACSPWHAPETHSLLLPDPPPDSSTPPPAHVPIATSPLRTRPAAFFPGACARRVVRPPARTSFASSPARTFPMAHTENTFPSPSGSSSFIHAPTGRTSPSRPRPQGQGPPPSSPAPALAVPFPARTELDECDDHEQHGAGGVCV
ncbi:SF3b1 domain-containing protein [Mycena venus]|uniref:SF3b1 domain-containing protein n=1 Tax=Mycena venus TaxID=2733690 RepID=A0A8H6XM27_9AGAR|nr:SF3b1 domain-containing protein [Mycena venus]